MLTEIRASTGRHVDVVEDKLLANRVATSRRELGQLRRTLVRLQRLLATEPAAMFRLLGRSPTWIGKGGPPGPSPIRRGVLGCHGRYGRAGRTREAAPGRARCADGGAHQPHAFVLTVVTVLALPVNLIAGLLGMNAGGIPFAASPAGFAVIVIGLALFTGAAAYLAFSRARE